MIRPPTLPKVITEQKKNKKRTISAPKVNVGAPPRMQVFKTRTETKNRVVAPKVSTDKMRTIAQGARKTITPQMRNQMRNTPTNPRGLARMGIEVAQGLLDTAQLAAGAANPSQRLQTSLNFASDVAGTPRVRVAGAMPRIALPRPSTGNPDIDRQYDTAGLIASVLLPTPGGGAAQGAKVAQKGAKVALKSAKVRQLADDFIRQGLKMADDVQALPIRPGKPLVELPTPQNVAGLLPAPKQKPNFTYVPGLSDLAKVKINKSADAIKLPDVVPPAPKQVERIQIPAIDALDAQFTKQAGATGQLSDRVQGLTPAELAQAHTNTLTGKLPRTARRIDTETGEIIETPAVSAPTRSRVAPTDAETPKVSVKGDDDIMRNIPEANINVLADDVPNIKVARMAGVKKWSHLMNTTDIFRILRDAFGDRAGVYKRALLDPLDQSKGKMVAFYKNKTDELQANVVKKGIGKNSKKSELLMRYGEGKNLDPTDANYFDEAMLRQELAKLRGVNNVDKAVQDIKEAEAWLRTQYDAMLDQYNQVMARIYPGNAEKIVPKRADYFHHFKDFDNGWKGVWESFTNPSDIGALAGESSKTRPKSKFMDFAQRRFGTSTKYDAVGGFLDYLKSAGVGIHISPQINRLRQFESELSEAMKQAGETQGAVQFKNAFSGWLNGLSGKSTQLDRGLSDEIGSRALTHTARGIQNIFAKNALLYNASTALIQPANMINGMAWAKQHYAAAIPKAVRALVDANSPLRKAMQESNFLAERYSDELFKRFDTGAIKKIENFGADILGKSDEIGTRLTWTAAFEKGMAEGLQGKQLIQYADENTRRLVGGRGIGEVPVWTNSALGKIVSPFTVEVTNLYHVYGDMVKAKDFGGLVLMGLLTTAFNSGLEQMTGRRPLPDAINAMWDIYADDTLSASQRVGRLPAEGLKALPLGPWIAAGYGKIADASMGNLPGKDEFFGSEDPSRYGTGAYVAQVGEGIFKGGNQFLTGLKEGDAGMMRDGALNAITPLLPTGGGGQIKKTVQGLAAVNEGVGKNAEGEYSYPVAPTLENKVKGALFGKNALAETKEYYKMNERFQRIKQEQTKNTEAKKKAGTDFLPSSQIIKSYTDGQIAKVNELNEQINKTQNDKNIAEGDKKALISALYNEKNALINSIDVRNVSLATAQDFFAEKKLSEAMVAEYAKDKNIESKYVPAAEKKRLQGEAEIALAGLTPDEKRQYLNSYGVDYWTDEQMQWWDSHPKTYQQYNDARKGFKSVLTANVRLSSKASQAEKDELRTRLNEEAGELAYDLYYGSSFDKESMKKKQDFLKAVGANVAPLNDEYQQEAAIMYRNNIYDLLKAEIPRSGISGPERASIKMEMMIVAYDIGRIAATNPQAKAELDALLAQI